METFNAQKARSYFDEIARTTRARAPGMMTSNPSDPLVILSEGVATVAAMIDQQMNQLPAAIATELPGIFGIPAQLATPSCTHIKVEPHPKSKDLITRLPEGTLFEVTHPDGKTSFLFRSKSDLDIFRAGTISLHIQKDALVFGLEHLPVTSRLNIFFDLEQVGSGPWTHLSWSYYDGLQWMPLSASDGTLGFFQSGIVDLDLHSIRPQPTRLTPAGTEEAYWFKVSFDPKATLVPVRSIHNNTVLTENSTHLESVSIGSSNGHPNQRVPLPEGQLASLLQLEVISRDSRKSESWLEIDSFFLASGNTQGYIYDAHTHSLIFGDGLKGAIPSPGFDNLVLKNLLLTNGSAANLPKQSTVRLEDASRFGNIELLTDCHGGTNGVTRRQLLSQLHTSLYNRDRAITLRDFEDLALKACPRVGRVFVRSDSDATVTLHPVLKSEYSIDPRSLDLSPNEMDLEMIRNYLESRRALNTRLVVETPEYLDLNIYVHLLATVQPSVVQKNVEATIQNYFSPLTNEGLTVELGQTYSAEHLHRVLEQVPNIFVIRSVKIENPNTGTCLPITALKGNQLPRIKCFIRSEEMRGAL